MKKTEPIWIDSRETLAIHDRLLTLHGGAAGLRDAGLLDSALARPQQHYAYSETYGLIALAALYTTAIVRNHPSADGNKRTGFVLGVLFLELNGFAFRASEEDATQAVLDLAGGQLDEIGYSNWLRTVVAGRKRR